MSTYYELTTQWGNGYTCNCCGKTWETEERFSSYEDLLHQAVENLATDFQAEQKTCNWISATRIKTINEGEDAGSRITKDITSELEAEAKLKAKELKEARKKERDDKEAEEKKQADLKKLKFLIDKYPSSARQLLEESS